MDSANQVFKIIEIFYHLDHHVAFTNNKTQRYAMEKGIQHTSTLQNKDYFD